MRLNIGQKIFSIALVILVLMTVVAAYSIQLTARISGELETVSTKHIPVSEGVARINVHILEQGLLLQRLFVLAGEPSLDAASSRKSRLRFENLGIEVVHEFDIARSILHSEEKDLDEHNAAAIDKIELALLAIENGYKTFEGLGQKLLAAREANNRGLFDGMLPGLNERQDDIDRAITGIRVKIEELANEAVRRADRDKHFLLLMNSILTALAAILGFGFAVIVTRALVRSVRNLVQGTEEVEAGNLDTSVAVTTQDEVGRLTDSFNEMVDGLRLKERIKETFGKYMDPRIVTNLLNNPDFSRPGGEKREMTVMFIDLKGFTSISEMLSPDDLVYMINRFFSHMTKAISDHKGVVDKFMGDAVMAYWGPPFTEPEEHAGLACQAAHEALQKLDDFRADVRDKLGDAAAALDIDLRIGISTGEMIVGTVGSEASKSFTVMGDPVNLGSRLEGASKVYGTHVLVSDITHAGAEASDLAFREMDLLRVKGKHEPIRIYELLVQKFDEGRPPYEALLQFKKGLEAYRRKAWDEAEQAFQAVLELQPGDKPAATYLDRIRQFRLTPPPPEWDGVWVLESK